jgi:DMSO/TMAO reductase YedYZ molybdopterin-dependent catalytic subunit
MIETAIPRRPFLMGSGTALAGLALVNSPLRALALESGEAVVPWLDQRAENPVPEVIGNQQVWEDLDSWITPNDRFFSIAHYDRPDIDAAAWRLEIGGLVSRPRTLTLDDIKALPKQELIFTVECSGNSGLPFFDAGIGNAQWAGTPLAALLGEAGVLDEGREVVFFGADTGDETIAAQTVRQHFARSMSLEDAMAPANILAYEMNGEALPHPNGFPLRLIAPGWFGIANVKWLERIEVWATRLENRFMARDYVTVRNIGSAEDPVWSESSVGRALLKSAPGRVVRKGDAYRIDGAAWGGQIAAVEVCIDSGDWAPASLDASHRSPYAWTFWTLDWPTAMPGEHKITSRATDTAGNVQPAPDDPLLASKATYWESNGQITRVVKLT